jgi:hypothetical protein
MGVPTTDPNTMTKRLPFTEASLARAIRGVKRAGDFVVGVRPDGTLVVSNKAPSIVPEDDERSKPAKRLGDYFNGGQGET